jgi:hypothetical protein
MITLDFVSGEHAQDLKVFTTRLRKAEINRITKLSSRIGVNKRVLMSYCIHKGLNMIEGEYKNGKK